MLSSFDPRSMTRCSQDTLFVTVLHEMLSVIPAVVSRGRDMSVGLAAVKSIISKTA